MPLFYYTAVKTTGEEYEGHVEVADRFEVYNHIRKEGGTVKSIRTGKDTKGIAQALASLNAITGTIKESDKIILARNLATMIKAGLALSRALDVMERQSQNVKLKKVLASLRGDVNKGTTFHDAMEKFPHVFSPLFTSMVRAGEESGKLAEALLVVSQQMEKAYNLKKKIRGALIYPTIIVIAMIVIGILMLVFVVPTLTQTFEELGVELPQSTQIVIMVSNFLIQNTVLALILLVVALVGIGAGLRTSRGARMLDFLFLHIPLIKTIVQETNTARTARTLSSLLSSGVEVVTAVSITRDVIQNVYYKEVLIRAQENIKKGLPMASAFTESNNLYPVLVGEMIMVGGETGKLSDMFEQIALFYESEVEQKTKDMSTVIEPFLMLFIGVVVGFFAISMISPIYSISSGI